jgi:surface protein
MFQGATAFNQDIGGWNTSSVIDMSDMFQDATSFNQDISGWNTSNVDFLSEMFDGDSSFNQSLSAWNVTSVIDASSMLDGTEMSIPNYDATLAGWAAQRVQRGVALGAAGVQYDAAGASARATLTGTPDFWFITDGGLYTAALVSTPVKVLIPQSPVILEISGGPTTGYTLTTRGGSGTGSVVLTISNGSAKGCSLTGNFASSTTSGICIVTATKSGDDTYSPQSSAPLPLSFSVSSSTGTANPSGSGTGKKSVTIDFASTSTLSLADKKTLRAFALTLPKGTALVINVHVKNANSAAALAEFKMLKQYLLSSNPHLRITVGTVLNAKGDSITIQEV